MKTDNARAVRTFMRAYRAAGRAVNRGDAAAAERWLKIAERHQLVGLKLYDLTRRELEKQLFEEEMLYARQALRREARAARDGVSRDGECEGS